MTLFSGRTFHSHSDMDEINYGDASKYANDSSVEMAWAVKVIFLTGEKTPVLSCFNEGFD